MKTITKKILVDRIATKHNLQRTAVKNILQDFLDEIVDELGEGNRIEFRDFGVFEVKHRAARTAQNPKTLERVPVPAKRSVRFKPGRKMREEMDAPIEQAPAAHSRPAKPAAAARDEQPEVLVERDVVATIGVRKPESVGAH
jgi:integration host factor subunit beta